ncbi:MAG: hypothetical protein IPN77_12140 [Sandaracinaceae bacterium]|nr:hypothetical protein [Sandaracinaceae bacterium]
MRFIRFAYLEDFQVAVTNERLLLFTRGGRLFGRKAGSPAAIEHADLVKAETFQAFALGSIGMRLTLANGLVYEFLVPKKLAGYEGQEAFVAGYTPWLTQGIAAQGFPARGTDFPRLPGLDMPAMLAHWALAGSHWLRAREPDRCPGVLRQRLHRQRALCLDGVSPERGPGPLPSTRIRSRAARLRGETPVPLLTLARTHRTKLRWPAPCSRRWWSWAASSRSCPEHMTEQEEADRQAENDANMASAVAAVAQQQAESGTAGHRSVAAHDPR